MLDELRKMGSLVGQGYFYGRPENAAETAARLANRKLVSAPPKLQAVPKLTTTADAASLFELPALSLKAG